MSFNKIELNHLIGQGTYGTVYKCVNEFNDEMAVKCINIKDDGIPCLMELALMSGPKHKYLNYAIKIHLTPQKIYIIQDLAISDLHKWRKNNERPSDEQLKGWSFQLLNAVNFLHKNNIIHRDIKSTNILIFSCQSELILKLSDFSLSCFTNSTNDLIGTYTHLPLELWLGRNFNDKIDIWALGCTLFELAFGYSLVPLQNVVDSSESNKFNKLTDMYINTLINLAEQLSQVHKFEYRSEKYTPCILPPSHSDPFENFLFSLLIIDSSCRPSSFDLLSLPYFSPNTLPVLIPVALKQHLPLFVLTQVKNTIRTFLTGSFNDEQLIGQLTTTTLNIFLQLASLSLTDTLKIVGSLSLAIKLTLKYSPRPAFFASIPTLTLSQLLQLEKTITSFLHFNLLHLSFREQGSTP